MDSRGSESETFTMQRVMHVVTITWPVRERVLLQQMRGQLTLTMSVQV